MCSHEWNYILRASPPSAMLERSSEMLPASVEINRVTAQSTLPVNLPRRGRRDPPRVLAIESIA